MSKGLSLTFFFISIFKCILKVKEFRKVLEQFFYTPNDLLSNFKTIFLKQILIFDHFSCGQQATGRPLMKLEFGGRTCSNFYNFFSNTPSDLLSNFESPILKLILFFDHFSWGQQATGRRLMKLEFSGQEVVMGTMKN